MRVLVANHSAAIRGGAEQYLGEIIPALSGRGLDVRTFTEDGTHFEGVAGWSAKDPTAQARICGWGPAIVFVNGLHSPLLEEWLLARYPVVRFAHDYYGTCVSGEKRHRFPVAATCSRTFGPKCAGLYWMRGCGRMRPGEFWRSFRLQGRRAELLPKYGAVIVSSEHMRAEFERHGLHNVRRIPLFVRPPPDDDLAEKAEGPLVFLGRLAAPKGVELMIRAVVAARERLGEPLRLVLLGDGSLRRRVDSAVARAGGDTTVRGWVDGGERDEVLRSARLLLFPSIWPEPFGLAGLEAGRFGVPAVAFAVGGVPEWLEDGVNGVLVDARTLSVDAFCRGIIRALALLRSGLELRRGAREVSSRFKIGTHVDALVAVFEGVASVRRGK